MSGITTVEAANTYHRADFPMMDSFLEGVSKCEKFFLEYVQFSGLVFGTIIAGTGSILALGELVYGLSRAKLTVFSASVMQSPILFPVISLAVKITLFAVCYFGTLLAATVAVKYVSFWLLDRPVSWDQWEWIDLGRAARSCQ